MQPLPWITKYNIFQDTGNLPHAFPKYYPTLKGNNWLDF